jgi:serine protease Do
MSTFNNNDNQNNFNEVSYYPSDDTNSENNQKAKKSSNGKKVLKFLGLICCMAIVSVGSITAYKSYNESESIVSNTSANASNQDQTSAVSDDTSSDTSNNDVDTPETGAVTTSVKAEATSLFGLAEDGDNLTPAEIFSKVEPSVVGISATVETEVDDIYSMFGYGSGSTQTGTATGTGIIMTADGYILTNAHVVEDAVSVTVILNDDDKTEYQATVIGEDSSADIAVLKIQADNLTPAEFGDSDNLVVGDYAYAIGNPLGFELSNTFTPGIISGLDRTVTINDNEMTLIQTSAAINSGNSGGPLVNSKGQVIGIVSSKISSSYSSSSASVEGLGFAIPITSAKTIIDDLVTYGYVTGRPQLGITAETIDDTMARYYNVPVGVYVRFMDSNGAAAEAGLQVGDIITGINGETISSSTELSTELKKYNAGDTIQVNYYRNGSELTVSVTLHEQTQDTNS